MNLILCVLLIAAQAQFPDGGGSQTTWTGANSSDWSEGANWTNGIPNVNTSVVIPSGTPYHPSTSGFPGAICLDLTVQFGATVDIQEPLDIRQHLVVHGVLTGAGVVRLVDPAGGPSLMGTVSGTGSFGVSMEIAKSAAGTAQATTSLQLDDDLILSSGTLQMTNSALISVGGNGHFQGGTLTVTSGSCVLDFIGSVTFSGTSATGILPAIRCGGNWTSNGGFAPQGSHVTLDGTTPQVVSASGHFHELTIAAGATVSAASSLTVNWTLLVAGSLTVAPHSLTAHGTFTVNSGASIALGAATHTFSNTFAVNGSLSATGTIVFDGSSSNTTIASVSPLPSVQIAKGGSASAQVNSDLMINGSLLHASGTFVVAFQASTVSVSGNATFQGGTLTVASVGAILDVAGNVTFSGTNAPATLPTIRCGGNWSANAGYSPGNGLVVFDGTGPQTISGSGFFDDLTVQAGSTVSTSVTLNLAGPLSVNGSLQVAPHSLDANGGLTVAAGGTLNLGGGSHAIGENLAVNGTLVATGTLVFDGSSVQASIASTATLPNVTISKVGTSTIRVSGNLAISGNLVQTSGTFQVAHGVNTVSVAGNALFQGGTLQTWNVGILDVAGNVTFSGTNATGGVPVIKCAGNWTSDASYNPSIGVAMLDGSGPQTISGAGVFDDLTIYVGANVSSTVPLTVNGPLIVNGSLNMAAQQLTAKAALNVPAGGTLNLGAGTHTFSGDFTANGTLTATGTVVLDGGVAITQIIASAPLPNLQIAKAQNTYAAVASNVVVNGNLTVTSGIFRVSNSTQTVSVSGNALLQGGELSALGQGTLDVAGNVTFSGTVANGPTPTIKCAGNWTSNATFAPSSCTLELDGTAPTTFTHSGASLTLTGLAIKNGLRTLMNDLLIVANAITIDANASLAVGNRHVRVHSAIFATSFTVNGSLAVGVNGNLALGSNTSLTIGTTGALSLVGTPAQPAKVTGEAGGGYAFTVNGAIAAKNFLVREMGAAGMVINASATISAPPNDLRGGTFDFRVGAPAGSVLLDIRRQAATNVRYTLFLNSPNVAGAFNVKTQVGSAPISLTNWWGPFSGPSFENDPGSQIAWNPPESTALSQWGVGPGPALADVSWRTASEVDLAGFEVHRASNQQGPYASVFATPLLGPPGWQYAHSDSPLVPNQTYFYTLYAKLTHDALVAIATGSTTPYGNGLPGNVKKVGGGGQFSTIQAAIAAASDANSVVWVTPGTYAPFTIGANPVPSNLRILGDASGPVVIDTSSGPIQILNVPAGTGVELSNLVVGSATTPQHGIVITNCACPIVLDEVTVACDAAHAAISVSNAPSAAIQRSHLQGGTGLLVSNGSYVAISRGSLSSLVSTGSTVELASLVPGSVNVTPAASLIARNGIMPDIDLPEICHFSTPSAFFLTAAPNAPFVIAASPRLGWQTGSSFAMPLLLDTVAMVLLPVMTTNGQGDAAIGFVVSPAPIVYGFSFTVQVAVLDPATGVLQLSNVESMVCVP